MGGFIGGEYEESVHVDDKPSFSNHVSEGIVHKMLKCGGEVVETKEHDGGFGQSFVGDKGCFPLMSVLDADVVVPPSNIKLSEVLCIFEFVNKVGDERKRVDVSDGMFIQIMIVLAGAEFPILLLDKEKRGGLGRIGGTDLSRG